jgi:hypothetical protein
VHARGDLLEGLPARLAEDVRFHSPVATYSGREDVAHLLATIGRVIDDVTPARELAGDGTRVTFFTARVGGREADGVLEETFAGDGEEVVELRLMLRPLDSLLAAVKAMGAALAEAPLPSQRGSA